MAALVTVPGWPPAEGEALDPATAAAVLEAFDGEIREAGRRAVAEIHAAEPDVKVAGRVYQAHELAGAVRGEGMPGLSVAYVTFLGRSGSISVVSIVLGWDGEAWAAR